MKIIIKIIITILILLILPISIYYGLRITNTPFVYEYMSRSFVVTLPNKVWFEINGSTDLLDDEEIFKNTTPEIVEEGYDIGPQYPRYTVTFENEAIKKIQTSERVGDTLYIRNNIEILEEEYDEYVQKIFFSQYGEFVRNTYIQEGCSVYISSRTGDISYNEDFAVLTITYKVDGINKIEDILSFEISCI